MVSSIKGSPSPHFREILNLPLQKPGSLHLFISSLIRSFTQLIFIEHHVELGTQQGTRKHNPALKSSERTFQLFRLAKLLNRAEFSALLVFSKGWLRPSIR
jgi:hypothetical protein